MRRSQIGLLAIILCFCAVSCGKKKKKNQHDPQTVGDLTEALGALGVPVTAGSRTDAQGNPLPGNYSPLGARKDLQKKVELLTLGLKPIGVAESGAITKFVTSPGATFGTAEAMLKTNQTWIGQGQRAVVPADIDGDGLEETLIVFVENDVVYAKWIDDSVAGFAEKPPFKIGVGTPSCLELAAGDFNLDGKDQAVLGLCKASGFEVLIFNDDLSEVVKTLTFPIQQAAYEHDIELAVGSVDYDAPKELAIVLNERDVPNENGTARFILIDDETTGFATLVQKDISGTDGSTYSAKTAGVAMGDIDADNVDEIILAGITNFRARDNNSDELIGYILIALDDASTNFANLATKRFVYRTAVEDYNNPYVYTHVFVNTLDIDGDRIQEIQVNEHIFDDFYTNRDLPNKWGVSSTQAWKTLETAAFLRQGTSIPIAENKLVISTGDLTHDGNDDILVFSPQNIDGISSPNDVYGVQAWGVIPANQPNAGTFKRKMVARLADVVESSVSYPIIAPINVDKDSIQVKFLEPLKEFVFTEPLIIAAIAAAPCKANVGQATDNCVTSFGKAESTTVEKEISTTVSASVHVGFSVEDRLITQSALEVEATVSTSASFSKSNAYTLTESVTYATGPLEDGVIFTTLPLDRFVYEISTHPDPELVGKKIVVSLPRKPITLKVDRNFYNSHIDSSSLAIDSSVFKHVPGSVESYPKRSDRDALIQTYGGFSGEARSVGQGTGSVETALAVNKEYGEGKSLAVGVELSVRLTGGGVMGGFTIGTSTESSLRVVNGTEKTYTGSVGDLPADTFAANNYGFGMFTYYLPHASGQKFEVLNYWVE